jgi:hypothetical protein
MNDSSSASKALEAGRIGIGSAATAVTAELVGSDASDERRRHVCEVLRIAASTTMHGEPTPTVRSVHTLLERGESADAIPVHMCPQRVDVGLYVYGHGRLSFRD